MLPVGPQVNSLLWSLATAFRNRLPQRILDQGRNRGLGGGRQLLDLGQEFFRKIDGSSHTSKLTL